MRVTSGSSPRGTESLSPAAHKVLDPAKAVSANNRWASLEADPTPVEPWEDHGPSRCFDGGLVRDPGQDLDCSLKSPEAGIEDPAKPCLDSWPTEMEKNKCVL